MAPWQPLRSASRRDSACRPRRTAMTITKRTIYGIANFSRRFATAASLQA